MPRRASAIAASPSVIADIQKTGLLLVVKSDAYETHPVIGFEINLAVKRKGVDLRIVSDKKGKLSKLPNAVTSIHRPGSEIAFFNAMAKVIIDENLIDPASVAAVDGFETLKAGLSAVTLSQAALECGVAEEVIVKLARDYAGAEKALIILPTGNAYPGHNGELAKAVINLALLTGRIGKEGNGVLILGEKNNSQGAADLGIIPQGDGKDAQAILGGCSDGSVKTLYIVGENPVVSYPNRKKVEAALDGAEFIIVQDLFLTETAAKADVVLPACSFAEKEGTFTSVGGAVQRLNRAIKPVGQARSDFEIFTDLLGKLTGEASNEGIDDVFGKIAATIPGYAGLTHAILGDEGVVRPVKGTPGFQSGCISSGCSSGGKDGARYRQRSQPLRHAFTVRRGPDVRMS